MSWPFSSAPARGRNGGLLGPIDDLARFLQLRLQDGELDRAGIQSPAATPPPQLVTVRGRRYGLGPGWLRPASAAPARRSPGTWAAAPGFVHLIRIYPSRGAGRRVGLVYSIWPGQSCGLGSSLSDLLGPLPAHARSARLFDGAGPG
jgi:hypothetical protein